MSAAFLLNQGQDDYWNGYEDARAGIPRVGPSMFAIDSRYDDGYDDGLLDEGTDEHEL